MIKYACKDMTNSLKELFNICFPGEEKFCDWFFENIFSAENTLVCVHDDILKGMAMEMVYDIEGLGEVTYLYGVATSPLYRGQGVCGRLLEASHREDIKKERKASILIPGNKGLFNFYEKYGYKKTSYIEEDKICVGSEKVEDFLIGECSSDDMLKIYGKSLSGISYVRRSPGYFDVLKKMYEGFGGGYAGLFYKCEMMAYCFYSYDDEGKVLFDEVMGENKDILMKKALEGLGKSEGTWRSVGNGKAFGMAYFYGEEKDFYMNLMFN